MTRCGTATYSDRWGIALWCTPVLLSRSLSSLREGVPREGTQQESSGLLLGMMRHHFARGSQDRPLSTGMMMSALGGWEAGVVPAGCCSPLQCLLGTTDIGTTRVPPPTASTLDLCVTWARRDSQCLAWDLPHCRGQDTYSELGGLRPCIAYSFDWFGGVGQMGRGATAWRQGWR